ncbi:MAG: ATP-binding protein [Xenococcaceae cyanobacterium]
MLLLDEFDQALYPNENYTDAKMQRFLGTFRNLAVHREEGQYLSTIVTSSQRLNELGPKITRAGSPWYNHYLFLSLLPFSEAEVNTLLNRMPEKDDEDEGTEDLQQGIREIAGGHPALLQNAGFLLYNHWYNQQIPDVDDFARKFVSSTEHFFSDAWNISTQEEKMLLMLIALTRLEGRLNRRRQYKLEQIDLIFSQMDHELRNLAERGVIQRSVKQDKEVYTFSSSIMEWWVIKEIENSKDEAELEQRQKVLLNLSKKQVEQIKTVMEQVWKNKDVIKSFAGWVGGLAGALARGWTSGNPL